ncbi:hypothetical protein MBLNU459_g7544t1 [Dothideomycetes sp. NU459]
MTDVCIVCLGDLRVAADKVDDGDDGAANKGDDANALAPAPPPSRPDQSRPDVDDETIAHLLPCGHNLHDSCLRPWVERANSCPTCRSNFNVVELREYLDAPAYSSYAVQDKQQQADVDATLVVEDDLFDEDEDEPCVVCGDVNPTFETMYCDACDATVHVFCAGYSDSPEVWYCERCLGELDGSAFPQQSSATRRRQTVAARQNRRGRSRRVQGSEWDRVWQTVWHRLNLDLDFPFAEEAPANHRTPAERREFNAWQRRLQVANRQTRQGGANRFRDTASTLLSRNAVREPESQEELSAWNAFDKAKHLTDDARPSNRRKRKSTTTSPASPRDSEPEPERKLKRPRTRRNHLQTAEAGPSTESAARPAQPHGGDAPPANLVFQHHGEPPSFLTSLLQEVEKQPVPADVTSPEADNSGDEQHSPQMSPASSPVPSGHVSPRALSVTPPPVTIRPSSPTPLTSIVRPLASPTATLPFSPFSPAISGKDERGRPRRRPQQQLSSPSRGHSPTSPSRNMSYSTKTEIQRMVKAALGSRYREKEITKDQYTDINRDVSRLLYDKVGDAEGLADQAEREKWQQVALDEVQLAIDAIRSQQRQHSGVDP